MKNIKKCMIIACAIISAFAFTMGIANFNKAPVFAEETERAAILHYDFSAENVSGTTVKNIGTKANADGFLFNGTGVAVENGKLVFSQYGDVSEAEAAKKGYFELAVDSLQNIPEFTFQVEVTDMVGPDDRDPFIAFTEKQIKEGLAYGDANKGVAIGDGWIEDSNYTFMESWLGGGWNIQKNIYKPYTEGVGGVLSVICNGATLSVWNNDMQVLSLNLLEGQGWWFGDFPYIRIGGMIYNWTGGLQGKFDNVKLYDYARSEAQLKADRDAFNASQITEVGNDAVIYYDFASANEGIIENLGAGEGMDGRIVQSKGDVYVKDGKLVIDNELAANTYNGYFRLPDNMFASASNWTIEMKVDHFDLNGDKATSFLSFSEQDFTVAEPAQDTNNCVQISYTWDGGLGKMVPFYQGIRSGAGDLWTTSTLDISTAKPNETKTIALIYKDGVATLCCDGVVLYRSAHNDDANYYKQFVFNKIGGYIFNWGRSSADIVIDAFAFYDYARPVAQTAVFKNIVEEVVADLGSSATALSEYTAYDANGKQVSAVVDTTGVDFATLGIKQFAVKVAGQATPARLTLTTRDLVDYASAVQVNSVNKALPESFELEYTDGSKVTLSVSWDGYEFKLGEQVVVATATDAKGRSASVTLTVTGIRGSIEELKSLVASVEASAEGMIDSSYQAMINAIKSEYDAAKAYIATPDDNAETLNALYDALDAAFKGAKGVLLEKAPLEQAIAAYGTSSIAPFAREAEKVAYENALAHAQACLTACESAEARSQAIEQLKVAYGALFVSADNVGFAGYTALDNGLSEIKVSTPPSNYWSVRQAISYTVSGDFEFSIKVKDYVKNPGAQSWFALTLLTVDGSSIMYGVGLNDYEADEKYPNGSPFANVNVNWEYPANVDCKAENGVFPETAAPATNWYTPVQDSSDTFNTSNPFEIKIWRESATNRYYFALSQDGIIRYAYYIVVEDVSDTYICLGSVEAEATVTDICLKGAVNKWSAPAEGSDWLGLAGEAVDGMYEVATGNRIHAPSILDANDKLYAFDFALNGVEDGAEAPGLQIGFVYKSGYVYDKVSLRFGEATTAEFYLTGSLSTSKEQLASALVAGQTYRVAIVVNRNGHYNILTMYVYDANGELLFQSAEYNMYNLQPLNISLKAEGITYKVSKLTSNDISGLKLGGLDESIYSPASVEKYHARLDEIGLSVYDLSNASEEEIATKIAQFAEAKQLLELAKVIGLVAPFDPIEVELNAEKVVLPVRARVKYDNGKEANLIVEWEAVDTSKEGLISVKGKVIDNDGNDTGCIIECPVQVVDYNAKDSAPEEVFDAASCSSSMGAGSVLGLFAVIGVAVILKKRIK